MEEEPVRRSGGAEAVINLQPNSSISIAYHPLFGPHDDILLLELDEKLLPDILHHRVTVRGQPDEDAVLCTSSTTYALKFVGNSNSVFLVPPADTSSLIPNEDDSDDGNGNGNGNGVENESGVAHVIKLAPGNMEIVQVAPRLSKLKMLLSENPYRSEEDSIVELDEMEINNLGLYQWEDLVNKVQASDDELRAELKALSAVEINGYWRIVDENYMGVILSMLLNNSIINDWSLNSLREDQVFGVLESDGFPRHIVLHCLEVYGNKLDEDSSSGHLWRLDEKRVCLHFARGLLKGGKVKMESFLEEWKQRIPTGMCASFEMLEGEALVEKLGVETWIRAFSVSSLPSTPAERFASLFRERPKWEWKDLQPYIGDLRVPGLSAEGLLLKYTRRSQPTSDAEPIFSAR